MDKFILLGLRLDGGSSGGGSINLFYIERDPEATISSNVAGGDSGTANKGGAGCFTKGYILDGIFHAE